MNARLKNQRFFLWFNKLFFPLLYLGHWHKDTIEVQTDQGAEFSVRVNSSDVLLIWEIWKKKIYADPRLPIRPGDTVVDIGAHIGVFSVWAARRAHRGRVIAYEAAADNFRLLGRNLELNGQKNLEIHRLAVFETAGEFDFYLPGANGALGSLLQDRRSAHERVQAVTLQDVIRQIGPGGIGLLKMDVEGAEYSIMLNTPPEILAGVRGIVLEYHEFEGSPQGPEALVAHLQKCGFETALERGIFPQKFLFGTGIIKAWRRPGN